MSCLAKILRGKDAKFVPESASAKYLEVLPMVGQTAQSRMSSTWSRLQCVAAMFTEQCWSHTGDSFIALHESGNKHDRHLMSTDPQLGGLQVRLRQGFLGLPNECFWTSRATWYVYWLIPYEKTRKFLCVCIQQ